MDERAHLRVRIRRRGLSRLWPCALALFLAGTLAGCATSYDKRGVYYKVRGGDSIWRIARIYHTDIQRLAEYNNILDPKDIEPGMRLYIPPRQKKASFKKLPFGEAVGAGESVQVGVAKKEPRGDSFSKPIQVYRGRFIWPTDGRVVSAFGFRDGRRHDGVDISGREGTPIHAAAAGKVVFAGSMRGYGNLILLRHKDDLFTAYSHNSENKVRAGQMVQQGQVIAKVGRTGRATGPHLHFELRHGQTARNPLFFLPAREGGVAYARAGKPLERGGDDASLGDEEETMPGMGAPEADADAADDGAPDVAADAEQPKQQKVSEVPQRKEKTGAAQAVTTKKASSTKAASAQKAAATSKQKASATAAKKSGTTTSAAMKKTAGVKKGAAPSKQKAAGGTQATTKKPGATPAGGVKKVAAASKPKVTGAATRKESPAKGAVKGTEAQRGKAAAPKKTEKVDDAKENSQPKPQQPAAPAT